MFYNTQNYVKILINTNFVARNHTIMRKIEHQYEKPRKESPLWHIRHSGELIMII